MITQPLFPRKDFLNLLTLVKPGLGASDLLPIIGCLCFDGQNLFTYNDEVGVWVPFKGNIKGAVNGDKLIKLITSSSSKSIDFNADGDDVIALKMGASRIKLNILPEGNFIFEIPKIKSKMELKLTSDWMEGIKLCLTTIADGDTRIDIRGVTFHIGSPCILYSTDNWSLSKYVTDMNVDLASGKKKKITSIDVIMRPEFCKAVVAAAEILQGVEPTMHVNKNFVAVSFGKQCTIYTRILDAEPLKFADLIDQTIGVLDSIKVIKIPKRLKNGMIRADVITGNDDTSNCWLSIGDGRVRVESVGMLGKHHEVMTIKGKHPDIKVMIHAQLMAKPLAMCDKFYVHENSVILTKGEKYICLIQNREV